MIEEAYSTHKSVLLAIRETVILYMFDKNLEKDIPKDAACFLSVGSYEDVTAGRT